MSSPYSGAKKVETIMAMITNWQHATEASWSWVEGATGVSTPSWEM